MHGNQLKLVELLNVCLFYRLDGADVVEYFQYDDVRDKIFQLVGKLLSIKIEVCTVSHICCFH